VNTNLHVTEAQARNLLRCVRYADILRDAYEHVDAKHTLPSHDAIRGLDAMLCAALERIRDLEQRNQR
jgi:xanthine dehydrogenase iron-sulfur cluster and FAD-binding subunit A